MEPIAQTLSTYRPESSLTLSRPLPLTAVEHIFDSLKGQLGAKVADMWNGVNPSIIEREWAQGLAGFQRHELQRGIDACAARIFAPTLGEFANLCRPCLDAEVAWHEAYECLEQRDEGHMGDWTHPAVFFAAVKMGPAVSSGDWSRHRKAWGRVLQGELRRGWREIPAPAMRVKHDVKVGPPDEGTRAKIARLRNEARAAAETKEAARMAAEASEGTESENAG